MKVDKVVTSDVPPRYSFLAGAYLTGGWGGDGPPNCQARNLVWAKIQKKMSTNSEKMKKNEKETHSVGQVSTKMV